MPSPPASDAAAPALDRTSPPPRVTLFVMAWRQEAFIADAVAAAFAQTWPDLEIILSDDASPDGTFGIMRAMAEAYEGPHQVTLNRNPRNLGVAGHIDRIMQLATGAFVIQSAGDDVCAPDRVARMAAAWQAGADAADGGIMLVHSAARVIEADGGDAELLRPDAGLEDATPLSFLTDDANVIGAAQGWSRALYDRFGPLRPEASLEDRPLPFRALLTGRIAYIDAPLIRYRRGGLSDLSADADDAWTFLYGRRLRYHRWYAASCRSHLRDLAAEAAAALPPAQRAACEALCRARAARYDFLVEMAEAGPLRRLALLPRAVRLGLAERSGYLPGQALRYLLDRPWSRLADLRRGRGWRPRSPRPRAAAASA